MEKPHLTIDSRRKTKLVEENERARTKRKFPFFYINMSLRPHSACFLKGKKGRKKVATPAPLPVIISPKVLVETAVYLNWR